MPSVSNKQRKFMGAALNAKRTGKAISPAVAKAAKGMNETQLKDFARKPGKKPKKGK